MRIEFLPMHNYNTYKNCKMWHMKVSINIITPNIEIYKYSITEIH